MSTTTLPGEMDSGTDDSIEHEDGASAEECWCTEADGPPCFAAFQAEKQLRGEH